MYPANTQYLYLLQPMMGSISLPEHYEEHLLNIKNTKKTIRFLIVNPASSLLLLLLWPLGFQKPQLLLLQWHKTIPPFLY